LEEASHPDAFAAKQCRDKLTPGRGNVHTTASASFWVLAAFASLGFGAALPVALAAPTAPHPKGSSSAVAAIAPPSHSSRAAPTSDAATDAPKKDPFEKKPLQPGVVHFVRGGKTTAIKLASAGQVPKEGLATLGDVLAKSKNERKPIDVGLAALIVKVSDHFGGRPIEVVAGSWSAKPGSTRHVAHTSGRAVDIRVPGVPLDAVRDYCATLPHAGVGYYPKEQLVHLDTRTMSRAWTEP